MNLLEYRKLGYDIFSCRYFIRKQLENQNSPFYYRPDRRNKKLGRQIAIAIANQSLDHVESGYCYSVSAYLDHLKKRCFTHDIWGSDCPQCTFSRYLRDSREFWEKLVTTCPVATTTDDLQGAVQNCHFPNFSEEDEKTHVSFSRTQAIKHSDHAKRTKLVFRRFLARYLDYAKLGLSESQLNEWARAWNCEPCDWELKIHDDPSEIYESIPNYQDDDKISGLSSCMTGEDAKLCRVFDSDQDIKLACWYCGNTLQARALLIHAHDGAQYLSRLYVRNLLADTDADEIAGLREQFATQNGWKLLTKQTEWRLSHHHGEHMPYVDITQLFNRLSSTMVEFTPRGQYEATSTTGFDPSNCHTCDRCDESVSDEDDLTTVHTSRRNTEDWCEDCVNNHTFTYDGEPYSDDCGESITVPDWLVSSLI